MPCFKFLTNLPKSQIPADFVDKTIKVLAKALRKPEERFTCVFVDNVTLSIDNDSKLPAAVASVESIGHISPAENAVSSKLLTDFVTKELNIDPKRFVITFHDLLPSNIAKAGVTVEQALAK